jgi:hypothetical protein
MHRCIHIFLIGNQGQGLEFYVRSKKPVVADWITLQYSSICLHICMYIYIYLDTYRYIYIYIKMRIDQISNLVPYHILKINLSFGVKWSIGLSSMVWTLITLSIKFNILSLVLFVNPFSISKFLCNIHISMYLTKKLRYWKWINK